MSDFDTLTIQDDYKDRIVAFIHKKRRKLLVELEILDASKLAESSEVTRQDRQELFGRCEALREISDQIQRGDADVG